MRFPTLYKKTATGAIQQWDIRTEGNLIFCRFGQMGGKMTHLKDVIGSGKNIGKANETTPEQQAESEAQSRLDKQRKKGYVDDLERAKLGKDDLEGYKPMLAHRFDKQSHKIMYPAYIQPKLDGMRCCAVVIDGKAKLFSRTSKPILTIPHIVEQLEKAFPEGEWYPDGELYNHDCRDEFEEIISMARREKELHPNYTKIQYHIYDSGCKNQEFIHRYKRITHKFIKQDTPNLIPVKVIQVNSKEEAMEMFEIFREEGYEGACIRNASSPYENKRSYHLQKIKIFDEEEFDILDIRKVANEYTDSTGVTKERVHLIFVCKTQEDVQFDVKMTGTQKEIQRYFDDESTWKNKILTVKFQGRTKANNVPRFPIGKAVRDYE